MRSKPDKMEEKEDERIQEMTMLVKRKKEKVWRRGNLKRMRCECKKKERTKKTKKVI